MDHLNSNPPVSAGSHQGASPFGRIRRTDGTGEWWSARDLQPLLGYSRWEDFRNSIERAKAAMGNRGQTADLHACERREVSGLSNQLRPDYRLTRYGAYLAAVNSDPRKAGVAAAQTYFAVQTHKAETAAVSAPVFPQDYEEALIALLRRVRENKALEAENRVLAPKASRWDAFMNSEGLIGMTVIADTLNMTVRDMTNWLVELGIFREQASQSGPSQNMPRRMYQTTNLFQIRAENNGKVSREVAYATTEGADFVFERWENRAAAWMRRPLSSQHRELHSAGSRLARSAASWPAASPRGVKSNSSNNCR
ncbi:phage antirepressor KilAC domain-containing protein [Streptomyces sp. NPDC056069]|uniref:phage antirepressor KilAC domain-containing protein n=1 Tax=Streptomyces sp. NPDC056069 TaxID=3345702 RepID=UPI0035DC5453